MYDVYHKWYNEWLYNVYLTMFTTRLLEGKGHFIP
jgi:hypothetical protein